MVFFVCKDVFSFGQITQNQIIMPNFYCEYCGSKSSNISTLTGNSCSRHPLGSGKGKHKLYEGSEKAKYNCKYCGTSSSSISTLTGNSCSRHPNGNGKGKHAPAL